MAMSTSRTFRKPSASYVIHASSSFPVEGASVCSATEAFCGVSTVFFDSTFGFTGATVLDFDGELGAGADAAHAWQHTHPQEHGQDGVGLQPEARVDGAKALAVPCVLQR